MMSGAGFGMGAMWLFGLLVLVGLVLLVVVGVRALGGGIGRAGGPGAGDRRPGRSRAREVLDERYAHGELNTAEYQERLQAIEGDS